MGERMSVIGALTPAFRIVSIFSIRECPERTYAGIEKSLSNFQVSRGLPLVMPVTEMPRIAKRFD